MDFDPLVDYPLGTRRPDLVRTPGGLALDAITLETDPAEIRATPETLRLQAEVARAAGRRQLGESLERAAELATIDDATVLELYTALRPRRSSAEELAAWAGRLDEAGAIKTAAFVREAAAAYAERGILAAL